VPCSYESTAMGKFALLRHLSEFRLRVSDDEFRLLSIGSSKSNHSGAQGIFKGALQLLSKRYG